MKQTIRNSALALLLWAACMAQVALAATAVTPEVAAGLAARKLLEAHDFTGLERLTSQWLADYKAGKTDGDAFFDTFNAVLPKEDLLGSRYGADLGTWQRAYPKSYAANYLFGDFLARKAWEARGSAFAAQTSARQLDELDQFAKQAEVMLQRSAPLFDRPYPTYCKLTTLARSGSIADGPYFRSAHKIDPAAFRAYSEAMRGLAPKWHFSGKGMPRFQALDEFTGWALSQSAPSADTKARIRALALEIKADDAEVMNGDHAAAISLYRQSYEAAPGQPRLWRLTQAAEIARDNRQESEAAAMYTEALKVDGGDVNARKGRGFLRENRRDISGAVEDYEVAGKGGDDWALNRIGWIYMQDWGPKNYDLAVKYLQRAADMGNENAINNLKLIAKLQGH